MGIGSAGKVEPHAFQIDAGSLDCRSLVCRHLVPSLHPEMRIPRRSRTSAEASASRSNIGLLVHTSDPCVAEEDLELKCHVIKFKAIHFDDSFSQMELRFQR
jgi:hypothetical protein